MFTAVPTAIAGTSTGSITDGVRGTTGTRTGPIARSTIPGGTIPGGTTPMGMGTAPGGTTPMGMGTAPGGMDTAAFTRAFPSVRAGADIPIITAPTAIAMADITRAMRTPGIPITAGGGTITPERFAREARNGARAAPAWGGVQEHAANMQAIMGEAESVR